MATNLQLTVSIHGVGQLVKATDLTLPVDEFTLGQGNAPDPEIAFTFGTGSGQANNWFHDQRSLANGAAETLDLYGVLTNPFGETLNFSKIKWFFIFIVDPDGTKYLKVGPNGLASAHWTTMLSGTGSYLSVYEWAALANSFGGFAVGAGTMDLLNVVNASGVVVTYDLWLGGVAS